MIEVRFHGRGGQGAVTAAELLAQAAIAEGKYAQGFPSFGPERRGAPVMAFLRISDEPIYLRETVESPDVVVVLDPTLIGLVDVGLGLKPNGTVVLNTHQLPVERIRKAFPQFGLALVDAHAVAMTAIGRPITNTAMIGAVLRATAMVSTQAVEKPLENRFGSLAGANKDAMTTAYDTTILEPPNAKCTGESQAAHRSSYADVIKKSALLPVAEVPIGGDIVTPGSSKAFFTGNWRTRGKPATTPEKCAKCGMCWILCPDMAYVKNERGTYDLDERYCKGCGICVQHCPKSAIEMKTEVV